MLAELHIQNFAIIQEMTLNFSQGLVVFTGETGAGKSIILDALSTVLGGRVDATCIRKGSERALIEASFRLNEQIRAAVQPILEEEALMDNPEQLTMSREIRSGGRNVARINGRNVNVSLQAEIGALLVDMHGQSEHLSLLKVKHHLELLDRFARHEADLAAYQTQYAQWLNLRSEYEDLKQTQQHAKDREDMLKYQIQEISSAHLKADEEAELRQERTRLANAETLHSLSQQALEALDEEGSDSLPVTDLLGGAVQNLTELSRIDPILGILKDRADQALSGIAEIAYELRSYIDQIEFNPNRLDQIEERLNLINFLKRKYGGSFESITEYLEISKLELETVENLEEQIEQGEQKIAEIKQEMAKSAAVLSTARLMASQKLTVGIEAQLENLQMKSAHFMVQLQQQPEAGGLPVDGQELAFDSNGVDKVEFLIETNPGEGFKPLVKVASGGETSRLMLALKHVLAEADQIPLLVFDEIDQGIGGRVGMTVGKMLWQLGREHQVMCVTHLPQLAAFGDQHFCISKQEKEGRTLTEAVELDSQARKQELASMIGPVSAGTLQSAQEILASVQEFTGKITKNG
ncbi:MAG: DNA repair protein RecN [Anaerolineaceae bacterium]